MLKLSIYITICLLLTGCVSGNRLAGEYEGGPFYWHYRLRLNSDSTFYMTFNGHLSTDIVTGRYNVQNDTINFTYSYSSQDTTLAKEVMAITGLFSLDSVLLFGKSNIRALNAAVMGKYIEYKGLKLKKKMIL